MSKIDIDGYHPHGKTCDSYSGLFIWLTPHVHNISPNHVRWSKIPLKLGINYIIELRRDSQGGLTDNTIVAVEM